MDIRVQMEGVDDTLVAIPLPTAGVVGDSLPRAYVIDRVLEAMRVATGGSVKRVGDGNPTAAAARASWEVVVDGEGDRGGNVGASVDDDTPWPLDVTSIWLRPTRVEIARRRLLGSGIDVNDETDVTLALCTALLDGDEATARCIVDARVLAQSVLESTLDEMCEDGRAEGVAVLVAAGVTISEDSIFNPLEYRGSVWRSEAMLSALLFRSVQQKDVGRDGSPVRGIAFSHSSSRCSSSDGSGSSGMGTVRPPHAPVVVPLRKCIATLTEAAARPDRSGGALAVCEAILQAHPLDLRHLVLPNGETPLACAASHSAKLCRLFLAHGADPNFRPGAGGALQASPLHNAAAADQHEACRLLIAHGALVALRDGYRNTPLLLAAKRNAVRAVGVLLQTLPQEQVDLADEAGTTPLMAAASDGRGDIARTLLAADAAVDAVDTRGYTALMLAAKHRRGGILSTLVAAGADVCACNCYGETAEDLACFAQQDLLRRRASAGGVKKKKVKVPKGRPGRSP